VTSATFALVSGLFIFSRNVIFFSAIFFPFKKSFFRTSLKTTPSQREGMGGCCCLFNRPVGTAYLANKAKRFWAFCQLFVGVEIRLNKVL
jgi:hypothetical protein